MRTRKRTTVDIFRLKVFRVRFTLLDNSQDWYLSVILCWLPFDLFIQVKGMSLCSAHKALDCLVLNVII